MEELKESLEVAVKALHAINRPDFVIRNDALHAYKILRARMELAKEAEDKIRDLSGIEYWKIIPMEVDNG